MFQAELDASKLRLMTLAALALVGIAGLTCKVTAIPTYSDCTYSERYEYCRAGNEERTGALVDCKANGSQTIWSCYHSVTPATCQKDKVKVECSGSSYRPNMEAACSVALETRCKIPGVWSCK